MADHLLDLTTLIEQPTIRINKTVYEILHPDQLGVLDFQRLSTMAGRVSALMKSSDATDDETAELTKIIEDLTDRIMVGVPADVRANLTESQRLAVAEVFMMLPRVHTLTTRRKPKAAKRSAGSRPRSDAKHSTAETPSAG